MKKFALILSILAAAAISAAAQTKSPTPAKIPAGVPIKPGTTLAKAAVATQKNVVDPGKVKGKTYTNTTFGFEVVFPDTWLIPGDDFEGFMKDKGYDLAVRVKATDPQAKANVRRFEKQVTLLLTAYRSMPGTRDNGIVLISVEDLTDSPKVKDAVDYFDLMRAQISTMKLPTDFKYSEVGAEKLGPKQFAYLETSSNAGKKRMYATVRGRHAIMFTLSYSANDDLVTLRRILEEANFSIK